MASVSTYLNFTHQTEAAFLFYKEVFGTDFQAPGFMRFRDMPPVEGAPQLSEQEQNLVMHVGLPITGGHLLMGTDAPESMGFRVVAGNNVYLNLQIDTRAEARSLFYALAEGGKIEQDLQDMFWGDYYGSCRDKFGVQWMLNCPEKA